MTRILRRLLAWLYRNGWTESNGEASSPLPSRLNVHPHYAVPSPGSSYER
jgi:hypothetical protein